MFFFNFIGVYLFYNVMFLLYIKVNQLHVYIYSLFYRFPSHLGPHRALSRFSLVTDFIHNSSHLPFPFLVSMFVLYICVSISALQSSLICNNFLDSIKKHYYVIFVSLFWNFPGGSDSKKILPAMQEIQVSSLDYEDLLEKGMETHSGILVWGIPWTEKFGKLQSTGSQRAGHG